MTLAGGGGRRLAVDNANGNEDAHTQKTAGMEIRSLRVAQEQQLIANVLAL